MGGLFSREQVERLPSPAAIVARAAPHELLATPCKDCAEKHEQIHVITHECLEGDALRCVIKAVPDNVLLELGDYVRVGDILKMLSQADEENAKNEIDGATKTTEETTSTEPFWTGTAKTVTSVGPSSAFPVTDTSMKSSASGSSTSSLTRYVDITTFSRAPPLTFDSITSIHSSSSPSSSIVTSFSSSTISSLLSSTTSQPVPNSWTIKPPSGGWPLQRTSSSVTSSTSTGTLTAVAPNTTPFQRPNGKNRKPDNNITPVNRAKGERFNENEEKSESHAERVKDRPIRRSGGFFARAEDVTNATSTPTPSGYATIEEEYSEVVEDEEHVTYASSEESIEDNKDSYEEPVKHDGFWNETKKLRLWYEEVLNHAESYIDAAEAHEGFWDDIKKLGEWFCATEKYKGHETAEAMNDADFWGLKEWYDGVRKHRTFYEKLGESGQFWNDIEKIGEHLDRIEEDRQEDDDEAEQSEQKRSVSIAEILVDDKARGALSAKIDGASDTHHNKRSPRFHLSEKIAHIIVDDDQTLNPNNKFVKKLKSLIGPSSDSLAARNEVFRSFVPVPEVAVIKFPVYTRPSSVDGFQAPDYKTQETSFHVKPHNGTIILVCLVLIIVGSAAGIGWFGIKQVKTRKARNRYVESRQETQSAGC